MNDTPGQSGAGDENPFKGTPFEQLFGAFGGALGGLGGTPGGGPGPGGLPDISALLGQLQGMMQPYDGPINWDHAVDTARKVVAQTPDPSPTQRQKDAVADAIRLADHWLDETTDFPSGVTTASAWSRAEWIVETTPVWKKLVEPIAGTAVDSLGKALPEEARALAGPLLGMLSKASGAMVAGQVGQGVGALAGEVWGATDVGIPLTAPGRAALLPVNVTAFAEGLGLQAEDVLVYLALREAAHHRLFAHVPWLADHLLGAITDYARGLEIDTSGIEEQIRGLDLSNPMAIQEALQGGLFDLGDSPKQKAALERLEITLALVEGWVDEVVGQATEGRMPAAAQLQEAVRRRRAAGGPAEQTFASLVGLELRPRRLRDASTLWGSLRTRQGTEARDGVWMHPHLLPTAADLDDPLGFREGAVPVEEISEEAFEAGLRDLLGDDSPADSADKSGDDSPTDPADESGDDSGTPRE
ncbi:zinc-dependent metalloprotease [Nocardioides campestrisoli]|uniref:zinc-dependent metalloprotease n=1 Tax=Nocardioides campestrisoli TaxID=2736757 RepID=UPI0015E6F54E|nr:zinc-dependent metalloprotease [Nocardioides campestrisoli]